MSKTVGSGRKKTRTHHRNPSPLIRISAIDPGKKSAYKKHLETSFVQHG